MDTVLHGVGVYATWFLQWSSWTNAQAAIVGNPISAEIMNHPAAVTLGKIKASLEN